MANGFDTIRRIGIDNVVTVVMEESPEQMERGGRKIQTNEFI